MKLVYPLLQRLVWALGAGVRRMTLDEHGCFRNWLSALLWEQYRESSTSFVRLLTFAVLAGALGCVAWLIGLPDGPLRIAGFVAGLFIACWGITIIEVPGNAEHHNRLPVDGYRAFAAWLIWSGLQLLIILPILLAIAVLPWMRPESLTEILLVYGVLAAAATAWSLTYWILRSRRPSNPDRKAAENVAAVRWLLVAPVSAALLLAATHWPVGGPVGGAVVVLLVLGVGAHWRCRHFRVGQPGLWERMSSQSHVAPALRFRAATPFPSRDHAFRWLLWRTRLSMLSTTSVAMIVFLVVIIIAEHRDGVQTNTASVYMVIIALCAGFAACCLCTSSWLPAQDRRFLYLLPASPNDLARRYGIELAKTWTLIFCVAVAAGVALLIAVGHRADLEAFPGLLYPSASLEVAALRTALLVPVLGLFVWAMSRSRMAFIIALLTVAYPVVWVPHVLVQTGYVLVLFFMIGWVTRQVHGAIDDGLLPPKAVKGRWLLFAGIALFVLAAPNWPHWLADLPLPYRAAIYATLITVPYLGCMESLLLGPRIHRERYMA